MPQNKEFCNDCLGIISIFRFFQAGKKKIKWALFESRVDSNRAYPFQKKKKRILPSWFPRFIWTQIASFTLEQCAILPYVLTCTIKLSFLKFTFTFIPWPHLVYLAQGNWPIKVFLSTNQILLLASGYFCSSNWLHSSWQYSLSHSLSLLDNFILNMYDWSFQHILYWCLPIGERIPICFFSHSRSVLLVSLSRSMLAPDPDPPFQNLDPNPCNLSFRASCLRIFPSKFFNVATIIHTTQHLSLT